MPGLFAFATANAVNLPLAIVATYNLTHKLLMDYGARWRTCTERNIR